MRSFCRGIIMTLLGAFLSGYVTGVAQAQQQYTVLTDREIFIVNMMGSVTDLQLLDPATKTFTPASSVTQMGSGSPWWDVVFASKVFTLSKDSKSYYLFYEVDGKPTTPLQVSLFYETEYYDWRFRGFY